LQGSSVVAFGWLGSYTGNCTLLQITFKYVTGSISSLRLSGTRTKLWDESNSVIVFQAVDGEVKVAQNYVTDVTPCKSIVGQGYPIKINVTVENRGYLTETFKVTVYANLVSVASQNVTLTGQSSTTLNFTWITAGFAYGNYTIEATADNTYVNGIIVVTVPGDVTGEIWVDMQDISLLIEKFMTTPSDPRWDPNCDINGDLSVDMADISIAIDHFMQA
jgi:hypothetical protein